MGAMRMAYCTLAALCALALAPLPLAAQEADGGDDTIVVTGENTPVTIRQAQRQARDIVINTGNVFESPLARFEDFLCPGIMGMQEDYAALMIDRIRANARELGVRVSDDGCRANFVVVFTDDGGAMMERLMDENPAYFQYLNSGQQADILEPGPVHVWTSVEPRTLSGMPIPQVRDLTEPPVVNMVGVNSLIVTTTRRDIVAVMITFDTAAVRGLSLGQLADYATMRGLAQTRPAGDLSIDSILTLFEGDRADPNHTPPQRLTDFDRAYLRSLYENIPNLPAARRLSGVGRHLRNLAEEGEGPQGE